MKISAHREYKIVLTPAEQKKISEIINKGVSRARIITRARILLLSYQGKTNKQICEGLGIERSMSYDIRRKFIDGGLLNALNDKLRPGKERLLTVTDEAMITAIACTKPKKGYVSWTIDLLTEEFNKKAKKSVCRNTVWRVLLRNHLKPWRKKNVVYSQGN